MSLLLGLAETLGVVSVVPFVAAAADPTVLERDTVLAAVADWLGYDDHRSLLLFLGTLSFVALVFAIGFRALTLTLQTRFSRTLTARFGSLLMGRYLAQDYAWFLGRHSSDLHKSILSEVEQVVDGSVVSAIRLLAHAAVAAGLFLVLLIADPFATLLVACVIGGAYGLIFFLFRRILLRLGKERIAANRARFEVVQEAIGGIKAVKLYHLEPWFLNRYTKAAERMAEVRTSIKLLSDLPSFGLEALVFGGMILFVLWVLISRDATLTEALPVMSLFAVAGMRLFPVLQQLFVTFATLRSSRPALDAIHDDIVTLAPLDVKDRPAPWRLKRALEVVDLSHIYPEAKRPTLSHVYMTVPAGGTVGLAGETGAGKSTLVDTLLGLLPKQSGDIRVDGQTIKPEAMRAWQSIVGYVPQVIHLMDDSVAANVALGIAPEAWDREHIQHCLETAVLDGFVASLPQGIETRVGERGVRLSGGQRQRLGIARALYRNPDFLVFDEATSALDTATEAALLERLRAQTKGMAVLMVAHRLTSLARCDTIYVLTNGRIEASGSYADLTEHSRTFRDLHALRPS